MAKLLMIIFLGSFMLAGASFADSELGNILTKKDSQTESKQKKSRRKKVQMCHECGKPEPECECEGEDHGVDHDHEKE